MNNPSYRFTYKFVRFNFRFDTGYKTTGNFGYSLCSVVTDKVKTVLDSYTLSRGWVRVWGQV